MAWDWKTLIPGYGLYRSFKNTIDNIKNDGFQVKDLLGWYGYQQESGAGHEDTVSDNVQEMLNDHGLDENGNIDINPADPTSSASNVINYDPSKSAGENMLGYAQDNNSASAYNTFLQNEWNKEMSNTAFSRAIADAEANGISKYQLFQSGNMAASTPSSGSSMYQSYENAMNRRESWNEKELAAITAIVMGTVSSAFKLIGKH